MKKNNTIIHQEEQQVGKDPILRRIQVQSTIIKKILAEIDKESTKEVDINTEDEMIFNSLEDESASNQKLIRQDYVPEILTKN